MSVSRGKSAEEDPGGGGETLTALEACKDREVVPEDGEDAAGILPLKWNCHEDGKGDGSRALDDIRQGDQHTPTPTEGSFDVSCAHVAITQLADVAAVSQPRVKQGRGDGTEQVGTQERCQDLERVHGFLLE